MEAVTAAAAPPLPGGQGSDEHAPRKRVVALMATWGKICPLKDAEDKRDARLVFCAQAEEEIGE